MVPRAACRNPQRRNRSSQKPPRSGLARSRTAASSRQRRSTPEPGEDIDDAVAGGLEHPIIQGRSSRRSTCSSPPQAARSSCFLCVIWPFPTIIGGCCSDQGVLHLMRAVRWACSWARPATRTPRRVPVSVFRRATASRMRRPCGCATSTRDRRRTATPIADGGCAPAATSCEGRSLRARTATTIGSPLRRPQKRLVAGYDWGMATFHPGTARVHASRAGVKGTLEEHPRRDRA